MTTWDETCPNCKNKLDMYSIFTDYADYKLDFDFECKFCHSKLECFVHQVPEFELTLLN